MSNKHIEVAVIIIIAPGAAEGVAALINQRVGHDFREGAVYQQRGDLTGDGTTGGTRDHVVIPCIGESKARDVEIIEVVTGHRGAVFPPLIRNWLRTISRSEEKHVSAGTGGLSHRLKEKGKLCNDLRAGERQERDQRAELQDFHASESKE
jgi:hypothetical protein